MYANLFICSKLMMGCGVRCYCKSNNVHKVEIKLFLCHLNISFYYIENGVFSFTVHNSYYMGTRYDGIDRYTFFALF